MIKVKISGLKGKLLSIEDYKALLESGYNFASLLCKYPKYEYVNEEVFTPSSRANLQNNLYISLVDDINILCKAYPRFKFLDLFKLKADVILQQKSNYKLYLDKYYYDGIHKFGNIPKLKKLLKKEKEESDHNLKKIYKNFALFSDHPIFTVANYVFSKEMEIKNIITTIEVITYKKDLEYLLQRII